MLGPASNYVWQVGGQINEFTPPNPHSCSHLYTNSRQTDTDRLWQLRNNWYFCLWLILNLSCRSERRSLTTWQTQRWTAWWVYPPPPSSSPPHSPHGYLLLLLILSRWKPSPPISLSHPVDRKKEKTCVHHFATHCLYNRTFSPQLEIFQTNFWISPPLLMVSWERKEKIQSCSNLNYLSLHKSSGVKRSWRKFF